MTTTSTGARRMLTAGMAALITLALGSTALTAAASTPAAPRISPGSGPVGTTLTVTGTCDPDLAMGGELEARITLSHTDAFTVPGAGLSYFHSVMVDVPASGEVRGRIKVGPAHRYTTQGPGGVADPGPDVTRAPKAGDRIRVQVLCYFGSPYPDVREAKDPFVVTGDVITSVKRPKAKGKARVGKTLRATKGKWSPTPTSVSYQWKRGKKVLTKATKKTYRLKKKDQGKKVSVVVTAQRDGYASASKASKKRKVKAKAKA